MFEFKRNPVKLNKKTYVIHKLEKSSEDSKINEIKRSFENPDEYFKVNPFMIVGKKIQGPRMDNDMKIVAHSIVGPVSVYEESKHKRKGTTTGLNSTRSSSKSFMLSPKIENQPKKKASFDVIDESKLNQVFQEYENLKYSSTFNRNEFMKNIPWELKKRLQLQEHTLTEKGKIDRSVQKEASYLSKTLKKSQDDLLLNKTESYRIKREIIDSMESKVPIETKYGVNNWIISLRRPQHFVGSRKTFINLGKNDNPLWFGVREVLPRYTEIARKPEGKNLKDLDTFMSNPYLVQTTEINGTDITHLDTLDDIVVKGRSLLDVEYKEAKELQGKKILYKKDYIENIVNGNPFYTSDFNKGNQNTEQVFVSNYDLKSFYKLR